MAHKIGAPKWLQLSENGVTMKNTKFIAIAIVFLLFAGAGRLPAQTGAGPQSAARTQGSASYKDIVSLLSFEGSSTTDIRVLILNSLNGYFFTKSFGIAADLLAYF